MANGGTLFLDEIGDMPLELQAVLLRVLDEKMIIRVGLSGKQKSFAVGQKNAGVVKGIITDLPPEFSDYL